MTEPKTPVQGDRLYVKRNVGPEGAPVYARAGEQVEFLGQEEAATTFGMATYYRVRTDNGVVILISPDALAETLPTVEERIVAAFQEGYSRGHTRGLNQGRLYGGDDQYSLVIQTERNNFRRELRDESDC